MAFGESSHNAAGVALRDTVLRYVQPILSAVESIQDSRVRLTAQACCLDLISAVEDLTASGVNSRKNSSQKGRMGR